MVPTRLALGPVIVRREAILFSLGAFLIDAGEMDLTRMRRWGVRMVRSCAAARRAGNDAAQLIVRSLAGRKTRRSFFVIHRPRHSCNAAFLRHTGITSLGLVTRSFR